MIQLKVGTKIKINKNLTVGYWNNIFCREEMLGFKGRLAIIKKIVGKNTAYKFDIDDEKWFW